MFRQTHWQTRWLVTINISSYFILFFLHIWYDSIPIFFHIWNIIIPPMIPPYFLTNITTFLDQLPYFLVNHNISPYFTIFLSPMIYIYIQVKAPYFFDRWPSSVPHPLQLSSWAWRTQSWRRMEPEMNRGSIFFLYFQHFETFEY